MRETEKSCISTRVMVSVKGGNLDQFIYGWADVGFYLISNDSKWGKKEQLKISRVEF